MGTPCDYQLRFFAPGLGIEEDPVTGSAHALVAPWWMEQLGRPRCAAGRRRRAVVECVATTPDQAWSGLSGAGQLLWDGQINSSGAGCDPHNWQQAVAFVNWRQLCLGAPLGLGAVGLGFWAQAVLPSGSGINGPLLDAMLSQSADPTPFREPRRLRI